MTIIMLSYLWFLLLSEQQHQIASSDRIRRLPTRRWFRWVIDRAVVEVWMGEGKWDDIDGGPAWRIFLGLFILFPLYYLFFSCLSPICPCPLSLITWNFCPSILRETTFIVTITSPLLPNLKPPYPPKNNNRFGLKKKKADSRN